MQIYWFSGRSLEDLCATTQISLASGLIERGYDLTFVNPDPEGSHADWPWRHQSISSLTAPGFRSRSLGKNMRKWFEQLQIENDAIALIDWRVANYVVPLFQKRNMKWILIDRSPPADKGILSLLQWPSWKKSWKQVHQNTIAHGCVVSSMHREFVHQKSGTHPSKISILPAGVNLELFKPDTSFPVLTMVYHGQLDQHRGVLALPMLLQKMNSSGLDARLILIGSGDCFKRLERVAAENENIDVYSTLEQIDLARILSQCHIGLLPMPKNKMWTLASPLKRSEYAASGLLIFGINHHGHRFPDGSSPNWMRLVEQYDFHEEGVKWFQNFDKIEIENLRKQVRKYAEEKLSWSHSIDVLEQAIIALQD